jgi:hypothetical protein
MTRRLQKLVEAYAAARVELSWKGHKEPAAWPELEAEVERSRQELFAYLEELCSTAGIPRE